MLAWIAIEARVLFRRKDPPADAAAHAPEERIVVAGKKSISNESTLQDRSRRRQEICRHKKVEAFAVDHLEPAVRGASRAVSNRRRA